eukprot:TRINITY_DN54578_c0_g1_i1.p1 TRINITY_DN54578_c0_g1~~TRINITY_DN54578_c0_g1_i1.p1  ORF type:complete len:646 (+),score=97.98 TRINITY_DN54578_c0_g1_i1:109-1938(+)
MASGLRQTLAVAIQRSSTSANYAAAGSDPSVGNVYMSNSHPAPAAPFGATSLFQNGLFGFFSPGPLLPGGASAGVGNTPMMGPGHMGRAGSMPGQSGGVHLGVGNPTLGPPQNQQCGCGGPGVGGANSVGPPQPGSARGMHDNSADETTDHEKDREIERLRRELRKSEEKTNFFRNQVMTLQHQLGSMEKPVQSVNSVDEVARLRSDLAEERVSKQTLQARVHELECELRAQRQGGGSTSAAFPAAGSMRSVSNAFTSPGHGGDAGSHPSTSDHRSHSCGHGSCGGYGGNHAVHTSPNTNFGGNPFDPIENPGGTRRALIVGCDYSGKIGSLRAGVSDAQQWARFFMKRCEFSERDIRLLTDDPAQYQQDRPDCAVATRDNILHALHWLVSRGAAGDQCFFVFCGHGAQVVVEQYAGRNMCENAVVPTDVCADGDQPRVVSDTDVHKALLQLPTGAQATLIYDCCHGGNPLDRSGLGYLTEHVSRGRVDYEKLRGHPVLPRFLELQQWKVRSTPAEAFGESTLRCQAVQWAACANAQFCVELPIDERPRGVLSYIFVHALLKAGIKAPCDELVKEMDALTTQLKAHWRLQQDLQLVLGRSTSDKQRFLR